MGKTNGKRGRSVKTETTYETTMRTCTVELTEAERAVRGDEMAACEVKIEALKTERSVLARLSKTYEKRRNELGHALEAGTEERELLCSWVPDYAKNVFRLTRPDTQAVVDTRAMTVDDRTVDLFADDAGVEPLPAPPPRSPRGRPRKAETTQTTNT